MALFYGGISQMLAGMWEFATGNTFGATGEYLWKNSPIIPFSVFRFAVVVVLTCEKGEALGTHNVWFLRIIVIASKSPFFKLRHDAEITLSALPRYHDSHTNIFFSFFLRSVYLLWCILAFIRLPLHPR